jgi:hypothetical protein
MRQKVFQIGPEIVPFLRNYYFKTKITLFLAYPRERDISPSVRMRTSYEMHQLSEPEQAEEIDDFYKHQSETTAALWSKYASPGRTSSHHHRIAMPPLGMHTAPRPIKTSTITRIVSPCPHVAHFDDQVEVVDSVVIDHVSEDDRSVSSEEVTFERWTEETRLIKTKVFRDGELVDEFIQRTSPELVGNILREKLIERHEHIKHISQVSLLFSLFGCISYQNWFFGLLNSKVEFREPF